MRERSLRLIALAAMIATGALFGVWLVEATLVESETAAMQRSHP